MTTTLATIDKEQALSVPDQARAFIVLSNDDFTKGEDFLALCKSLENSVHADLDDVVKQAHGSWKASVALRDKYLTPLEEGRRILKQKMIAYQDQQEQIRREAQRKAEDEAKARAEEEALAAALQAEKEGDTETAEAIISEPVQVAPVIVPKSAPTASRLSAGREVWSCEVTSLMDLCKAIVAGKASINMIEANMPALNQFAKAMKSTMQIPGVKSVMRKV
jgi:hypothetical protein